MPDPVQEPVGSEIGIKVVRPIWSEMQDEMMARFDALTIEELCQRARREGIVPEEIPEAAGDFAI